MVVPSGLLFLAGSVSFRSWLVVLAFEAPKKKVRGNCQIKSSLKRSHSLSSTSCCPEAENKPVAQQCRALINDCAKLIAYLTVPSFLYPPLRAGRIEAS